MNPRPRSVDSPELFPYKEDIRRALELGVRCRKDDRELLAGKLVGTYQIRLSIAKDPKINGGVLESENDVARDLTTIVNNLSVAPETAIAVYYIGPTSDSIMYFLMEYEQSGGYVGCFRGRRPAHEG